MKRTIVTAVVSGMLAMAASCGDTGPSGPSPLPGPTTVTPPTITVPQLTGTYRGKAGYAYKGGRESQSVGTCVNVEHVGEKTTLEFAFGQHQKLEGEIDDTGKLRNVRLVGDNWASFELTKAEIQFRGAMLATLDFYYEYDQPSRRRLPVIYQDWHSYRGQVERESTRTKYCESVFGER